MPSPVEWAEEFTHLAEVLASTGEVDWNAPDIRNVYLQGQLGVEALHLLAAAKDALQIAIGRDARSYIVGRIEDLMNRFDSASVYTPQLPIRKGEGIGTEKDK